MRSLEVGVRMGKRCCGIILEVIKTWEEMTGGSLEEAQIFAWKPGHDSQAKDGCIGSSILLQWLSLDDEWLHFDDNCEVLNLVKPQGTWVNLVARNVATSLNSWFQTPLQIQRILLRTSHSPSIASRQVTLHLRR
jgi:hypothetical protein